MGIVRWTARSTTSSLNDSSPTAEVLNSAAVAEPRSTPALSSLGDENGASQEQLVFVCEPGCMPDSEFCEDISWLLGFASDWSLKKEEEEHSGSHLSIQIGKSETSSFEQKIQLQWGEIGSRDLGRAMRDHFLRENAE